MHVGRRRKEPTNPRIKEFYQKILSVVARDSIRHGTLALTRVTPAWDLNSTCDKFLGFTITSPTPSSHLPCSMLFIVVNFSDLRGQCYAKIDLSPILQKNSVSSNSVLRFKDLMHDNMTYDRVVGELVQQGMYFDVDAYFYHIFEVTM